MKYNYEKINRFWRKDPANWCYQPRWSWYRPCKTAQTCRQYVYDEYDIRYDEDCEPFKLRPSRNAYVLNAWNLEPPVSRAGGKSWKDYTKHRKQWEKGRPRHVKRWWED